MTHPVFPMAPLEGLSSWAFLGLTLVLGAAFGFFLERAGFGSAKNLTSIFILRDFRVFRVMFSAVVTAMIGSQILSFAGLLDMSLVSFDRTFFWAMLAGGLVFGVGFYVGGFCPGTAVVALVRGRIDGLAFLVGIIFGIYGFALLYDAVGTAPWFVAFYAPEDATHQSVYGEGPIWLWVAGITAIAIIAFVAVPFVERRFALKTVEQLKSASPVAKPKDNPGAGPLAKWASVAAATGALAVALLELLGPGQGVHEPAAPIDDQASLETDPLTVAGWVVAEAHRKAGEEPPQALFLDLRQEEDPAVTIPGAVVVRDHGDMPLAHAALTHAKNSGADLAAAPIVLIDSRGHAKELAGQLRRKGLSATVLQGGIDAWEDRVLAGDHSWPAPLIRGEEKASGRYEATRHWLSGKAPALPPRLSFPGTIPSPAKAATVQAVGGGGGGCG